MKQVIGVPAFLADASLVPQFVAYGGYSSVGQTFYMDAFDQIGGSQYTLRHVLHFPPTPLQPSKP